MFEKLHVQEFTNSANTEGMKYLRSTQINMKSNPNINESWVQSQIIQDPSLLGLGNLEVIDKERRQPRAGRLDLLLWDEGSETRYTVEIQLGPTDESHIIRTIEYWDIERNRYPQINHVAIIVAEDITSRFLNVISLFNKSVPIIAIQLNAFQVGEDFTLACVKILDTVETANMDEDETSPITDREFWLKERASSASLALLDEFMKIVREVEPAAQANYRKRYVGITVNGVADNFVAFRPRKVDSMVFERKLPFTDEMSADINDAGFDQLTYSRRGNYYRISIRANDRNERREKLKNLISEAFRIANPSLL